MRESNDFNKYPLYPGESVDTNMDHRIGVNDVIIDTVPYNGSYIMMTETVNTSDEPEELVPANNEIWYTTSTGDPWDVSSFPEGFFKGANNSTLTVVNNSYNDKYGVLKLSGDLKSISVDVGGSYTISLNSILLPRSCTSVSTISVSVKYFEFSANTGESALGVLDQQGIYTQNWNLQYLKFNSPQVSVWAKSGGASFTSETKIIAPHDHIETYSSAFNGVSNTEVVDGNDEPYKDYNFLTDFGA